MSENNKNQEIENFTTKLFIHITQTLGEDYHWQWDNRKNAVLSEFSRDKIDVTLELLQQNFHHQWTNKSIKKAPTILKEQLADLAKLNKEQLLFTTPKTASSPALLAIWWPWGHGATVSLRLLPLTHSYEYDKANKNNEGNSIINWFKKLF